MKQKCTSVPSGTLESVKVFDTKGNNLWAATPNIAPGDAWVFTFYYDEMAQMVMFAGKQDTAAECSATDFSDLFPGSM